MGKKRKPDKKVVESIKYLIEEGAFETAEKELKFLSEKFPSEGEIFLLLSESLFKQEKFQLALENLNKSISFNPDVPDSYHLRGYSFFYLHDYISAEKDLQKAIELNDENSHIYYLLGHIYSRTGKREKAILNFSTALEKGLQFPDIYEELAKIFDEAGEHKEALRNLLLLCEIKYNDPEIHYSVGRYFFNLGSYFEAIEFINKAIFLGLNKPEVNHAKYLLGLAYCSIGRFNIAEKVVREAIMEEEKVYEYYDLLGRILISRIDYKRARNVYEKILTLKLEPHVDALFHIALTYILENKYDTAVDMLNEILIQHEDHIKSHYTIAILYSYNQNSDWAVKHWEICIDLDPEGLGEKAKKRIETIQELMI